MPDIFWHEEAKGRHTSVENEPVEGASWAHQECVGRLYEILRAFQRRERLGRTLMAPFDILIQKDPLRTRQPDVLFIFQQRLAELGGIPDEGSLPAGPELIIEVLSPSDTPRTLRGKSKPWLYMPMGESLLP
ncbi:MAG: hypothetical protein OHK0029_23020 [Armatimonadaceae bacterium]